MNTWFITGCSSGLGHGIAAAALSHGEQVVMTARNTDTLRDFTANYPNRALALSLELNDRTSIENAVNAAVSHFGNIDVLVNNAGHGYRAAIEESEPDRIAELFNVNFFAPMDLIKLVLPQMRAKHSGTIVNITSIGAVRGALGNGYYSAAKGALELASEALAKETAHLCIRVMLVEPGAFRTAFYDKGLLGSRSKIADYDKLAGQYRKDSIINSHDQLGDPEKGGNIIVETVLRDKLPFRLLLGSDALKAAEKELTERLRELREWAPVSAGSDHEI